ncbi:MULTISPECIES: hypothetical protein [Pseudomonas]|uniref:hypothetical protein n=1 Tax=Pseudomonas TaxID=286 RepID=UPI00211A3CC4|nr:MULTISPECIES: hypothetical protein [Pseudomonas]MCV3909408.1 hypothetical protein [Pseudomonas aeruginosa]MDY1369297.1 hypothetical protein [Pseudomonas aeruginosa]MDY1489279.1 hypothetical protein [Pseudomonas aeruginosa]
MPDLGLEGLDETTDNYIRVSVIRKLSILRKAQVYPEGQDPRVVIHCPLDSSLGGYKIFKNKWSFLGHDWHALEGVLPVQMKIRII